MFLGVGLAGVNALASDEREKTKGITDAVDYIATFASRMT